MRTTLCTAVRRSLLALTLAAAQVPVQAALVWDWGYDRAGVTAGGTFTTNDAPDSFGYFTISNITGQRNGVTITGLQGASTPIPGNEPFAVDNLVRETGALLSANGFGFSMVNGTYANVFHASFLPGSGYLEFLSVAPFVGGAAGSGPEDSQLEVSFRASILRGAVPEPAGSGLVAMALAAVAFSRRALHKRASVRSHRASIAVSSL